MSCGLSPKRISAHPLAAAAAPRQPQVYGLHGPPLAVGAGQQHARHLILQLHLGEVIAASPVVGEAGLILALSPPGGPGPDVVGVVRAGWMTLERGRRISLQPAAWPPHPQEPGSVVLRPCCFLPGRGPCTYQQSQRPHPGHARRGPPSLGTPDHCPAPPCCRLGLVPLTPPQHGAN
jgi:hypothetical protein